MKVLILQLSDIHLNDIYNYNENNIKKIINAITIKDNIIAFIVIVSGDITFSGKSEEFEWAKLFFKLLEKEIQSKFPNSRVDFFIVPGNHDVLHEHNDLSSKKLRDMIEKNEIDSQIKNELAKLKNFFIFSKMFKCFEKNNTIIDVKKIEYGGKQLQLNLVNTAIFSLLKDEQGLHYLPEKELSVLVENTSADFVITVMHHPYYWFCWDVKNKLENLLYNNTDIVFVGHEHKEIELTIESKNSKIKLNYAGELSNKGDWKNSEFYIGILDINNRSYLSEHYTWHDTKAVYSKEIMRQITLTKNRLNKYGMSQNKTYISNLLADTKYMISHTISDYYVFPLLEKEMHNENKISKEIQEMSLFIKEIISKRKIVIKGGNDFGKTSLLNQLLVNLSTDGYVLLIQSEQIISNKYEKIIKNSFEEIYSEDPNEYTRFCQAAKKDKIILVDDFDSIIEKWSVGFFSYIEEYFGIIILSHKNDIDFDIRNRIRHNVLIENYDFWNICPFYVDKRRELVSKIVRLLKNDDELDVNSQENLINILCQTLSKQKIILSFNPEFIIQFVKYYCNNVGEVIQNEGNIFSKVFETNLVNFINPFVKKISIDKIFIILSKIAYHMHVNKVYPMAESEIQNVIKKYNDEFDSDVNMVNYISTLVDAQILVQIGAKYRFAERHYYAYFIAREIKRRCMEENDFIEFEKALRFACFGINSDILLFVTYMTDSLTIIQKIMSMADEYADKWSEFSLSPINVKYLSNTNQLEIAAVQEQDKVELEIQEVQREKKEDKNKYKKNADLSIYTYDEDKALSNLDEMIRILSLMIIVSKTLPSFEHMMKKKDKEQCVSLIYILPLKIFGIFTNTIEKNKKEIIDDIKDLPEWTYRKDKISLDDNDILNKLRWESMSLLLDLINASIYNATKENTNRFIDNFDYTKSIAYQIEHLMALDNRDDSNEFVKEVEKIYKSQGSQFVHLILKRIVNHHMLISKNITRENIQKLNEKLWGNQKNSKILLLQKNNRKNIRLSTN